MGTLLDVIRADTDQTRHPPPRLDDLPALVATTRSAGMAVALHTEGVPRPLPAALDLSAYRIVQEALTNTLKHAAASRVDVVLRYRDTAVEVDACDNGSGSTSGGGTRRGLVGIGERVAVFGGEFSAGPRDGGGWSLGARLPVTR